MSGTLKHVARAIEEAERKANRATTPPRPAMVKKARRVYVDVETFNWMLHDLSKARGKVPGYVLEFGGSGTIYGAQVFSCVASGSKNVTVLDVIVE